MTKIAMCGLDCTNCRAYIATQTDDDEIRHQVADYWSTLNNYDPKLRIEDINCDGCVPGTQRIYCHCANCSVRACGLKKGIENCAACDSYPCETLMELLPCIPRSAEENLRELRALREKGT